ncbi:MAG TPA: TldD/PmbA family protein [Haliangiales bacterium]|nr:TldD/PmbA family protein [Haliangiales bacterium]
MELAHIALEAVRRVEGVSYADARVVAHEAETLALKDADIEKHVRERSAGIGVRVLYRGAWGFGAQPGLIADGAAQAARDALASARAAASLGEGRVRLVEEEPQRGTWETPLAEDPFAVPLDRKLADLEAALAILRGPNATAEARMVWRRERKRLCTTEGTDVSQVITFGGAGIRIVLRDGDDVAVRTWPMDYDGGVRGAGYETIADLALAANAPRLRAEAAELLAAPPLPAGTRTLILDTPQLALQIHESCGHPTESDRALGEEISLAGGSFLTPDKLGRFRYGAPIVNLSADSLAGLGMGTFGWDDEGVPARKTPLVARGMFVGYLSSRETAARLGLGRSAGCLRAESWSRPAIIRMINVSLEPDPNGPATLDDLVADTADGVLMTQNRSWSIDDLRLNFQFGCEAAWEVKDGRRGRMFKKPMYTGSTPRFWAGCDAICGPGAFRMWGYTTCGKGDPIQLMAVGHGTAPARFRNVEVGSS